MRRCHLPSQVLGSWKEHLSGMDNIICEKGEESVLFLQFLLRAVISQANFLSLITQYVVAVVQSLSHSDSFVTPWTVAHQALLSMGFPRLEYWNVLLFPSPGDLSNPGIKPVFPAVEADSLLLSHQVIPYFNINDFKSLKWKKFQSLFSQMDL